MNQRQPGLKRSVAIQVIAEEIREHDSYSDGRIPPVEAYKPEADEILKKLEALGLKPPFRDADQRSSYGYARVQEWENE